MNILAIDGGLEKTGYAIINIDNSFREGFCLLSSGTITSLRSISLSKRLLHIYSKLNNLIITNKVKKVILEQLFFFKNQKTFISVAQAQGIILLVAAQNNIEVEFLTPLQIKEIVTGYGRSDKKAVQKMLKLILNIDINNKNDDEADAIACGLAYCYLNKNLVR